MTEWFYKATPTKVSFEETRSLAVDDGFLCRSAFETNHTKADNASKVRHHDIIHMYYAVRGEPRVIGSFEVVSPYQHGTRSRFTKPVDETVLWEVDEEFARKVTSLGTGDGEGYATDPVLNKVTGWPLRPRAEVATPPYVDAPFVNQATLVRRT